jgi:hypothetical protein
MSARQWQAVPACVRAAACTTLPMRRLRAWHATTVPSEVENEIQRHRWLFCDHAVEVGPRIVRVAARCPLSQWNDRRRELHAPLEAIHWKRYRLDDCVWFFGAEKPDSIGGVVEGFVGMDPDPREAKRRVDAEWRSAQREVDDDVSLAYSAGLAALGLQAGATPADVRAAFRRLSFDVHPDRGGSHEKFVELNAIYSRALASVGGA